MTQEQSSYHATTAAQDSKQSPLKFGVASAATKFAIRITKSETYAQFQLPDCAHRSGGGLRFDRENDFEFQRHPMASAARGPLGTAVKRRTRDVKTGDRR